MTDDRDSHGADTTPPSAGGPPPPPPGLFPDQPVPQAPPEVPPYVPPAQSSIPVQQTAPPVQAAYAQPAPVAVAAATPPRKKRTGLVIGLVVAGLLVLCGLGSCVAFVLFSGSGDTADIKQAEAHYAAAQSAIASATTAIGDMSGSGASAGALASATAGRLRAARDELASSRAAIEQAHASDGRTKYLASLTAATQAVDGLDQLLAYATTASNMAGVISEAGAAATSARAHLNAAVSAGNAKNYSKMKNEAQAASTSFVRAATLFREADKLDTTAGLSKAASYADTRNRQAQFMMGMADEGRNGKASAYNKDIKRVKALDAQASKIGEPAIVTDPNWAEKRLSTLTSAAKAAADKADQLHAQALKALNYTG